MHKEQIMLSELEMAKNAGKNIKVTLLDGQIIIGFCRGFTQAIDNEPEIAEIDIELENGHLTGAFQDEIESIEVVEG